MPYTYHATTNCQIKLKHIAMAYRYLGVLAYSVLVSGVCTFSPTGICKILLGTTKVKHITHLGYSTDTENCNIIDIVSPSHRRILTSIAPALRQHCKLNPTTGQLFDKQCRWVRIGLVSLFPFRCLQLHATLDGAPCNFI